MEALKRRLAPGSCVQVTAFKIGDRVMSPFTTNCGGCFYCKRGTTCRCCHQQAHVFGWLSDEETALPAAQRRGLHGSQAQFVRVPLADSTLLHASSLAFSLFLLARLAFGDFR